MSDAALDHFTIGAATLDDGVRYLRDKLAIEIPPGSKHDMMSTHNRVLKAGDGHFLELIAIDPDAPQIAYPRWFALDDAAQRARISARPRPLTWIVRTSDVRAIAARSPVDLGPVKHFVRGERYWDLTVRPDGTLPGGGLIPSFIQWSEGPHPSQNMKELGPRLEKIVLRHQNPAWLKEILDKLGVAHLAEVSAADAEGNAIEFVFRMPDGKNVVLD